MYPLIVQALPDPVDLTGLPFAINPNQSGNIIGGSSYICTQDTPDGKVYIKLPKYDPDHHRFSGHESLTEVVVSRYLDVIGIPHLDYQPLFVRVFIDGKVHETIACVSKDFCSADEEQIPLKDYYEANRISPESVLAFCRRMGWAEFCYRVLLTDYLVLNRDRYNNNLILLKDKKTGAVAPAPLFDHGLCLLSQTRCDEEVLATHILWDAISMNYLGTSFRVRTNLKLIPEGCLPHTSAPTEKDRSYLFRGLAEYISPVWLDRTWEMLTERYRAIFPA